MLLAHSLCILYILQVPRVHDYINKVCCVHYYIPFITTAFFLLSIHTTAMMMTTTTTNTTTRTPTVTIAGIRNDCWGVPTVGERATVVIVLVTLTVGAIVVVTVRRAEVVATVADVE